MNIDVTTMDIYTKANRKRRVLRSFLNPTTDSEFLKGKGSSFQSLGAATANERSPNDLVLDFGMDRRSREADRVDSSFGR